MPRSALSVLRFLPACSRCCRLACCRSLPIVLGTAASEHKLGPLALAVGLAISFTDHRPVRRDHRLRDGSRHGSVPHDLRNPADRRRRRCCSCRCCKSNSPWPRVRSANGSGGYLDNFAATGLAGQFGLGLLLGAVWSPCVGPTLGAASLLAAKGENLGQVAITMLAFGIGAALPLMLLGFLSREAMQRWRGRLLEAGKGGKTLLGVLSAGDRTVDRDRARQAARGSLGRRLAGHG